MAGTNFPWTLGGGQFTSSHSTGTVGSGVASALPGRLCKITVTTLGTEPLVIYDNATTSSGNVIYVVDPSVVVGQELDVQLPTANGIYVKGSFTAGVDPDPDTYSSGIVLSYNKDTLRGR